MKKLVWRCLVGVACLAACGDGGQAEAEAALKALKTSYDAVKADAATYAPKQAESIEAGVAAVEESVADGEYTQALLDAKTFSGSVAKLGTAVAAKKMELTTAWESLAVGVPPVIQGLQAKLDELSKAARLPKGVDKAAVAAAKAAAAGLSRDWDAALAAFKSSNVIEAVSKAQAVKATAATILGSIGQPLPEALK